MGIGDLPDVWDLHKPANQIILHGERYILRTPLPIFGCSYHYGIVSSHFGLFARDTGWYTTSQPVVSSG